MELIAGPFLSYASMRFRYCTDQRAAGQAAGLHRVVHLRDGGFLHFERRGPLCEQQERGESRQKSGRIIPIIV